MASGAGNRFIQETMKGSIGKTETPKTEAPSLNLPFRGKPLNLPKPNSFKGNKLTIKQAVTKRKSHRKYSDEPITLLELSYALWAMQGVHKHLKKVTLRTVPSAGARHAFHIIVLVNNVKRLTNGLYLYDALHHKLHKLDVANDMPSKLEDACLGQKMITGSAVTFFYVADVFRMTSKYRERGYRYLFLDAGHAVQNLYLVAEDMDAGTVAIGAYDDQKLNDLFNFKTEDYFVIYIAPLGKKA
jgi:SagB-type dehydrogenase family enzyme